MLQFYQPFILEFSKTEHRMIKTQECNVIQHQHSLSVGFPFRTDCLIGFFNGDMMIIISCAFSIETLLRVVFICSSNVLSLRVWSNLTRFCAQFTYQGVHGMKFSSGVLIIYKGTNFRSSLGKVVWAAIISTVYFVVLNLSI